MKCQTQGCEREASVRGWCKSHYVAQWKKEKVSIEKREGNENYLAWVSKKGNRVPEWDSFEVFNAAVGASPGEGYRITRLDTSNPWGPENAEWRKVMIRLSDYENMKEYSKAAVMNHKFRNKYGIDLPEYKRMHEAQKGVCAICGQPETNRDKRGRAISLAVDHCHAKGNARALLCSACNTGLGMFKDSPLLIAKAIEYLKSHTGD